MSTLENIQILLNERPKGLPDPNTTWKTVRQSIDETKIPEGSVLVRVEIVSLDPAMRGWMSDLRSYLPPVPIGVVMRSSGAGTVVASKNSRFQVGDRVMGLTGWQNYLICEEDQLKSLQKLPPATTLPAALGVLGTTGMTAYFGITDIGKPKPGETVVVSGAAGATGSVACQIAKILGCRVIGIAGGPEKCKWIKENCGVDVALDYKSQKFREELAAATPKFIDVYYDNVGGEILDDCLHRLNFKGRVVLCGAISQYNAAKPVGPRNYTTLITQRGRMEGFIVLDYVKQFPEAISQLSNWIQQGKLHHQEEVVNGGITAAPESLMRLFRGENTGKLLVRVAPSENENSCSRL